MWLQENEEKPLLKHLTELKFLMLQLNADYVITNRAKKFFGGIFVTYSQLPSAWANSTL